MKIYLVLGSGFALGMVAAQGCAAKAIDPLHCANNDGDAYCRGQLDDGIERFCQRGTDECYTPDSQYGCVEQRPADECYSPCGDRQTIDENGECVMVEDSSTGTSTGGTDTESTETGSSESTSTTGPMPCVSDEECTDVAAPYCADSGVCVPCDEAPLPADGDAACATADPGLPVCFEGACVQCTPENPAACSGMTPVCDEADNACVPCTAHDQCGEAACNLFTGACLPADRVFEVGGPMADFPSLSSAIASLEAETETTFIVHPGMMDYNESVAVTGGRVVAFLAAEIGPGIEPPRWVRTSGNQPQLDVTAGTTVLMDGLQLSGNSSTMVPGMQVTGGRAWVDRSRIVQNSGGGIVAETNAELVLRNCFVGQDANDVNALEVNDATADILYSTLGSGTVSATSLACASPMDVIVRNSIIVSRGNAGTSSFDIMCPEAMVTYTATESLVIGMGNEMVGDLPTAMPDQWFVGFGAGDFHLQNQGLTVFADIAQWTVSDPPTDIDGDPRPEVDGTADFAGADVP